MPHKLGADPRDRFPKQKHRVTNWTEYNEGLRRRINLMVWIGVVAGITGRLILGAFCSFQDAVNAAQN